MDRPEGNEGNLNGTTAVDAVPAPAAADYQRIIGEKSVKVYNADTVAHTITLQKNKNSTVYVLEDSGSLAAGAAYQFASRVILDATDESLEVVSDATATTTEPTFDAGWLEVYTPPEAT